MKLQWEVVDTVMKWGCGGMSEEENNRFAGKVVERVNA